MLTMKECGRDRRCFVLQHTNTEYLRKALWERSENEASVNNTSFAHRHLLYEAVKFSIPNGLKMFD